MAQPPRLYDPSIILSSPEFRKVSADEAKAGLDPSVNLGVMTNPNHDLSLVAKPRPKARKNECVVHVKSTGVCGSDVHFWKHGHIGPMIVTNENGLGHESSGEIVEVGEGVTEFKVGDRVAIECGVPCGRAECDFCRQGRYNACPDVVFFSTPPYHGTLTRYHLHPAAWLHKMPDNMSFEEGALLEPLVVALSGIERANIRMGQPTLICGAGPIGLVTLLSAKAVGAAPIVITDLSADRLAFAKKLVPTVRTVQINTKISPNEQAQAIRETFGKDHIPTQALECTGVESSIHTAIFSVNFGGMVMVIGVGKDIQTVPFMHLSANEIDLRYLYRYNNMYPRAIRMVADGLIDLKPLATHSFPLHEAIEAFNTASDPSKGAIKVQIVD